MSERVTGPPSRPRRRCAGRRPAPGRWRRRPAGRPGPGPGRGRRRRTPGRRCSTRRARWAPRPTSPRCAAGPGLAGLGAPVGRCHPGQGGRLLAVHRAQPAVVGARAHDVAAGRAGDPQPGSGRTLPPAALQHRPAAAGVVQHDQHVVVQPGLPHRPAGEHAGDRAEQQQCLVDEVAAEVQQRAAAGDTRPGARCPPLEPRLQRPHLAQGPFGDQPADGAEVGVPAAVLVGRERQPGGGRPVHRGLRRGGVEGEGLVADDGQAEVQRPVGQLAVRARRGGDRDGLGARVREGLQGVDAGRAGVVGGHQRPALLRRRHHPEELDARGSGQQRGVEIAPAEAVADQPEPHRTGVHGRESAGSGLSRAGRGRAAGPRAR